MKRTPMKRRQAKVSASARLGYKLATARANGCCEARIDGICNGRAEARHHIKLRSRGGDNSAANIIVICDPCHRHIHSNPLWATEHAFMESSWVS